MNKVLIQLIGDSIDIEDIKFHFETTKWKIENEYDTFYLTTEGNLTQDDIDIIKIQGKELLNLLNGAATLIYPDHKEVKTGHVTLLIDGKKYIFVSVSDSIRGRSRAFGKISNADDVSQSKTPSNIETWISMAEIHEEVRDVLYFIKESTWWNLYKVYEIIRKDVIANLGKEEWSNWKNNHKIDSFCENANNRGSIGDLARHGISWKPREDKINLEEAHVIIRGIFEEWIKTIKSLP